MKKSTQIKQLNVGEKIRFYRLRRNLSQYDLANEAGIGFGSISDLETGVNSPSVKTIFKLSTALNLSLLETAYLFGVNFYLNSEEMHREK